MELILHLPIENPERETEPVSLSAFPTCAARLNGMRIIAAEISCFMCIIVNLKIKKPP